MGWFLLFFYLERSAYSSIIKISFVYLNSKPFRNPGLCRANKEDQAKLLLLGQLRHSELPGSFLQQDPLENLGVRVRETDNLHRAGHVEGLASL